MNNKLRGYGKVTVSQLQLPKPKTVNTTSLLKPSQNKNKIRSLFGPMKGNNKKPTFKPPLALPPPPPPLPPKPLATLSLPAPPPLPPKPSATLSLPAPPVPPKSNNGSVNNANNLNEQFRRENEARKRLIALNDEKFKLRREKAKILRNKQSFENKIKSLKQEKVNFIKTKNEQTRKNANMKFNTQIANLNSKLSGLKNTRAIDNRLRQISSNMQRSNNKKFLKNANNKYGPQKQGMFGTLSKSLIKMKS